MKTESTKAGADYEVYADRLPKVNLTAAEILNLHTTILRILDSGEIRWLHVEDALLDVFGGARGATYIDALRKGQRADRWTRRENVRILAELYPYIPGTTEGEKAAWLIDQARPCFTDDRFDDFVMPYVLERIEEYRAAGGTLERWPEVIEPPAPPPPPPVDPAARGFLWKPISDSNGRPVVLLPPSWTGKTERDCAIYTPAGQRIEAAAFTGVGNGDREHYRFKQRAGEYPANAQVRIDAAGSTWSWTIPNPTARYENLTAIEVDPVDAPPAHKDNPRYDSKNGEIEIPAEFLKHGQITELRFQHSSLANGLMKKKTDTVYSIPKPDHEVWQKTEGAAIGTKARFADGTIYDGYVRDYRQSYPMPIKSEPPHGQAFWIKMT